MQPSGRALLVWSVAWVLIVGWCIAMPFVARGEDNLEVLKLKREVVAEKLVRLQTTMELLKRDFAACRTEVERLQKSFADLNAQINKLEPEVKTTP